MAHLQPRDIFTQSAPRPIVIWRGILCSRICNISTAAVFAREFAPADSLSLPQPLDSVDTTGHTQSLTAPFHMECVLHDTNARENPQYFWGYVDPDYRCVYGEGITPVHARVLRCLGRDRGSDRRRRRDRFRLVGIRTSLNSRISAERY